ncbi:MAG TPA: class I SAM-dependent methyltransferase [Desulfomonilaceae bacterium]|nr:class I SAM-dependent methyltransferase [Desulfomonilaceae bacterium]
MAIEFPDPRKSLGKAAVYNLFVRLIGADKGVEDFVRQYLKPRKSDRILDIGCGTAQILNFLHDVEYVGLDMSQDYIDSAKMQFGHRASFHCQTVSEFGQSALGEFDVAIGYGVLHHLTDEEATEFFRVSSRTLKPGGRLLTADPCYISGQSLYAKILTSLDRGNYVRRHEEYVELAHTVFPNVTAAIRRGRMPFPFTNTILEATG